MSLKESYWSIKHCRKKGQVNNRTLFYWKNLNGFAVYIKLSNSSNLAQLSILSFVRTFFKSFLNFKK